MTITKSRLSTCANSTPTDQQPSEGTLSVLNKTKS